MCNFLSVTHQKVIRGHQPNCFINKSQLSCNRDVESDALYVRFANPIRRDLLGSPCDLDLMSRFELNLSRSPCAYIVQKKIRRAPRKNPIVSKSPLYHD